jgi:hypothetical protein
VVQADGVLFENDTEPIITGTPTVLQTLQVSSNGTWTATPTGYTYQWQHCDNVTYICTDIAGATTASYVLVASDIGQRVAAMVTATYGVDTASATSNWTKPVEGIAPTGPAPTLTGIARVGETLTASVGEWQGQGPLTTTWSWGRIESLEAQSGGEIEGANSNTYTLTPDDLGMIVVAVVIVTGPLGTGYASAPSAPVVAAPAAGGASQATNTGTTITVSGSGFAPDSDVTVVLRSDPVTLGVAHTDATGSFTATFPLPAGVAPGVHTLVFTGVDAAGNPITVEQTVTIVAATGALPVTGTDALPLTGIAAGLMLAGAVALRAGRRRAPLMT